MAHKLSYRIALWFSAALAAFPLAHAIIHSLMAVFGFPCP